MRILKVIPQAEFFNVDLSVRELITGDYPEDIKELFKKHHFSFYVESSPESLSHFAVTRDDGDPDGPSHVFETDIEDFDYDLISFVLTRDGAKIENICPNYWRGVQTTAHIEIVPFLKANETAMEEEPSC